MIRKIYWGRLIVLVMACVSLAAWKHEDRPFTPSLSTDQKLSLALAQRDLMDAVAGASKQDLLRDQAQQRLFLLRKDLLNEIGCADEKKWRFDDVKLECVAVPALPPAEKETK